MNRYDQKGFTLVEMAIVLVVLGLIAVPFIQQYRNYIVANAKNITQSNIEEIISAINKYVQVNGMYPCPDTKNLPIDDPAFGTEDCPVDAVWADPAISVLSGAVPVQVLGIDTKYSLDGWFNKFTYVVTKNLTRSSETATNRFDLSTTIPVGALIEKYLVTRSSPNAPSVNILSADPLVVDTITPTAANNSGHVAVISHGPSGAGGYNAQGNLVEVCPASGASLDQENCDGDAIFYTNRDGLEASDISGADFYDDIMQVFSFDRNASWAPILLGGRDDTYSFYRAIGISTDDPMGEISPGVGSLVSTFSGAKKEGIDVDGNVKVESTPDIDERGQALANTFCDETGESDNSGTNNCFEPRIVAGSGINCGFSNTAIRGIANNNAVCLTYVPLNFRDCAPGEYIKRILADGSTQCGPP